MPAILMPGARPVNRATAVVRCRRESPTATGRRERPAAGAPDIRPLALLAALAPADEALTPSRGQRPQIKEDRMTYRLVRALLATTVALLAIPAASANAALIDVSPCDDAALSQPFQRWGDTANYKLAPGGDFEAGTAGWTLARGATTVAASEPWGVTGETGTRALSLPAGASAVTPATCVNAGAPTFRFFARSTSGLLPLMKVDLVYRDGALGLVSLPVGVVTPSSTWQPTLPMLTGSIAGAALAGGDAGLSLRFTAVSGTWQVDDVFVDPYARR
jgi:hypothetical protein